MNPGLFTRVTPLLPLVITSAYNCMGHVQAVLYPSLQLFVLQSIHFSVLCSIYNNDGMQQSQSRVIQGINRGATVVTLETCSGEKILQCDLFIYLSF
jgi:hypothetical protein